MVLIKCIKCGLEFDVPEEQKSWRKLCGDCFKKSKNPQASSIPAKPSSERYSNTDSTRIDRAKAFDKVMDAAISTKKFDIDRIAKLTLYFGNLIITGQYEEFVEEEEVEK